MYRVDKRIFNVGETIFPTETSYQDELSFKSPKQKIEQILDEVRPESKIADRKGGLFIFQELSDAIRFSCLLANSKIYKVKRLNDTNVFHRGDMNWTETMGKLLDNETALNQLAVLYWSGCKTFKPCWECIVDKMQVDSIVVGSIEEGDRLRKEFHNKVNLNIERLNFYIENLKLSI